PPQQQPPVGEEKERTETQATQEASLKDNIPPLSPHLPSSSVLPSPPATATAASPSPASSSSAAALLSPPSARGLQRLQEIERTYSMRRTRISIPIPFPRTAHEQEEGEGEGEGGGGLSSSSLSSSLSPLTELSEPAGDAEIVRR